MPEQGVGGEGGRERECACDITVIHIDSDITTQLTGGTSQAFSFQQCAVDIE